MMKFKFFRSLMTIPVVATFVGAACPPVLAADERGNGGDIVYCPSGQPFLAKALDLYEGETHYGLESDIESIPGDEWAIAESLIRRIEQHDKDRADLYLSWLNSFASESLTLYAIELVDIPDSHHIALPVNCQIVQLIIQKEPDFPGEARYTVNGDYWNMLTVGQRAAMIIHELMYREVFGNQYHQNSKRVRYFMASIASKDFVAKDLFEYIKLLTFVKFQPLRRFSLEGFNLFSAVNHYHPKIEDGLLIVAGHSEHNKELVVDFFGMQLHFPHGNFKVGLDVETRDLLLVSGIAYVEGNHPDVRIPLANGRTVTPLLNDDIVYMHFRRDGSLCKTASGRTQTALFEDGRERELNWSVIYNFNAEGFGVMPGSKNKCH